MCRVRLAVLTVIPVCSCGRGSSWELPGRGANLVSRVAFGASLSEAIVVALVLAESTEESSSESDGEDRCRGSESVEIPCDWDRFRIVYVRRELDSLAPG